MTGKSNCSSTFVYGTLNVIVGRPYGIVCSWDKSLQSALLYDRIQLRGKLFGSCHERTDQSLVICHLFFLGGRQKPSHGTVDDRSQLLVFLILNLGIDWLQILPQIGFHGVSCSGWCFKTQWKLIIIHFWHAPCLAPNVDVSRMYSSEPRKLLHSLRDYWIPGPPG